MTNGSLMKVESSFGAFCNTLTCIKRYSVVKTNLWSSFWVPLKTGFTVYDKYRYLGNKPKYWDITKDHKSGVISDLKYLESIIDSTEGISHLILFLKKCLKKQSNAF